MPVPIIINTQYDDYGKVWEAWAEGFHELFVVRGQDESEARTRMQRLAERAFLQRRIGQQ